MNEVTITLVRAVVTFSTLFILSRIMGKTQIGHLTFFEYVTGITIGSIAGALSVDLNVRPWPMFVSMLAWFALTLLTQWAGIKNRWVSRLLTGQPVVVVQNGQILEGALRSLRMNYDDLDLLLRTKNVFDVTTVEFALMEPNGELSVLKRSQHEPVTPADLGLSTDYKGLGVELIVDGEVMDQNLRTLKLNHGWLYARLRERGLDSPKQVFLAIIDTSGQIYFDLYKDQVPGANEIGDYPGPN